jgi:hypothetical protein
MLKLRIIFKKVIEVNIEYKVLRINFKVRFKAKFKEIFKCLILRIWTEDKVYG